MIENGVFAAYIGLNVNFNVAGINISGGAVLVINSGTSAKTVYDAQGTGHLIDARTFKVTITATLDFFGVFTANGTVVAGVENGVFSISVNATLHFFSIVDVSISGYFSVGRNGAISFSITGTLNLNLTVGSGATESASEECLSITLTNSSFTGRGSVGLVIFGEDINIASAEITVNWANGSWSVYAEGPLSVWLRVSGNVDGTYSIMGGLGVFDAVFEALGDAAEAVGEAVVAAAEAVADALEDLGNAILDFGQDVAQFFDGLFTDIANLAQDVWNEVSSWFESDKTEVTDLTSSIHPSDYYSYTASPSSGTLTINNSSASRLALAVVNGQLIIDAPDVTRSVAVAVSISYHRSYTWDGWPPYGEWGPWHETSRTYVYRDITFSNMLNFTASTVTKIVVNGTNSDETIVEDKDSVSINSDVYGNGGNDTIVTGQGNDRVWGGSGNDTIFTNGDNDELYGEDGNDKLMGGTGNDYSDGGAGDDLLDENDARVSPEIAISETNTLDRGERGRYPGWVARDGQNRGWRWQ